MVVFNVLNKNLHSNFTSIVTVTSHRIHTFSRTTTLPLSLFLFTALAVFPILSSSYIPIISDAWPATFFVDATSGNDTNNGTSELTTWKTIAKVNASRFHPGDQILFKRGAAWREKLVVPSSGNTTESISFGAFGSGPKPIIAGSNLLSGWTAESANLYYTRFAADPKQVFKAGQRLIKVSNKSDLSAGRWWWDSSYFRIYVYDNPLGYEIEASSRDQCVLIKNRSHVTIRDLTIRYSIGYGVEISTTSGTTTSLIIDGITAESNYWSGIKSGATPDTVVSNLYIGNSLIFSNGGAGISIVNILDGAILEKNTVYRNCLGTDGTWVGRLRTWWEFDTNAGIKIASRLVKNVVIQQNQVYENGFGIGYNNGYRGVGIWVDTAGSVGNGNIVRRNLVFNNNKHGIMSEDSVATEVSSNIVYGHASNTNARGLYISRNCKANRLLHNTVWGNSIGISVQGSFVPVKIPGDMVGNIIQNNIISGNTVQLAATYGGENDGVFGSNNIYSHNCFGLEKASFIEWGVGNFKSTYAAWEHIYGLSNSIKTNPNLVNPAKGDFELRADSPCIGAGLSSGGWVDFNGNSTPQNAPVDIGALKY